MIEGDFGRNTPTYGKIPYTPMHEQPLILTLHESAEFIRVICNHDPSDWIAEYRKVNNFPARQWAERMVAHYTQRQTEQPNG